MLQCGDCLAAYYLLDNDTFISGTLEVISHPDQPRGEAYRFVPQDAMQPPWLIETNDQWLRLHLPL